MIAIIIIIIIIIKIIMIIVIIIYNVKFVIICAGTYEIIRKI